MSTIYMKPNIKRIILQVLLAVALTSTTVYGSGQIETTSESTSSMVHVEAGEVRLHAYYKYVESKWVNLYLDDYYISPTETSVGEWREFLAESGHSYSWKSRLAREYGYYGKPQNDNQAIHLINFFDALEYCNWRSREDQLEECYTIDYDLGVAVWSRTANGYRLPTEAEWQWAAMGGHESNGYTYAGSNDLYEVTDVLPNEFYSFDVGSFVPNELGLFNMTGNVSEVCWDSKLNSLPEWNDGEQNPISTFDYPPNIVLKGASERITRGPVDWNRGIDSRQSMFNLHIAENGRYGIRLARNYEESELSGISIIRFDPEVPEYDPYS